MHNILLKLKRHSIGDGLCRILENSGIGKSVVETQYENLPHTAKTYLPKVILLEVPESGTPTVYGCITLAEEVRNTLPHIKILLMCSELDLEAVEVSIEAKKTNKVDDFIFYDTSMEYLKASIKALI